MNCMRLILLLEAHNQVTYYNEEMKRESRFYISCLVAEHSYISYVKSNFISIPDVAFAFDDFFTLEFDYLNKSIRKISQKLLKNGILIIMVV